LEEIVSGALYIVSTPIGNLGDISFRATHILNSVDIIAAEDTRVTSVLLNRYDIHKKMIPFHSHNQKRQTPILVKHLLDKKSIALVSDAGTPGISDPAYILVQAAVENKIQIIPIPGASALLAALVVTGLPVNRFVFEGFLPLKKGRRSKIQTLASEERTIVFYESPHRIQKTVRELNESWGNRRCVMGREITKKFEEFYHGGLADLLTYISQKPPKGEIVLIVEGLPKNSEKKIKYATKAQRTQRK
jgi:16S rRNA (cytidine1402-2'-O)-methyltransferase